MSSSIFSSSPHWNSHPFLVWGQPKVSRLDAWAALSWLVSLLWQRLETRLQDKILILVSSSRCDPASQLLNRLEDNSSISLAEKWNSCFSHGKHYICPNKGIHIGFVWFHWFYIARSRHFLNAARFEKITESWVSRLNLYYFSLSLKNTLSASCWDTVQSLISEFSFYI